MENVSKALAIAGGLLISILVTTLLVVGLSRLRHYQNVGIASKKNEQLAEFNQPFESYNKQIISGYELISIGHLTEDTNKRYREEDGYQKVEVWVSPKSIVSNESSLGGFCESNTSNAGYYNLVNFTVYFDSLSDTSTPQYNQKRKLKESYFKCDSIKYDDSGKNASGRVIEMKFKEITKKER